MKTIRNWEDLGQYGINCLTGEACGYGYRLLCDLTHQGQQLIQNALEIPTISLRSNWNGDAISSIMLPPQMFTPLAIFALFDAGCKQVFVMHNGAVLGVEESDSQTQVDTFVRCSQASYCEDCGRYGKGGGIQYQYKNAGYSRNRHVMTGRAA